MPDDLAFIADELHCQLLRAALDALRRDPDVVGVLLAGSLARGDARPGADIDLVALLRDGRPSSFIAEERDGILVEVTARDAATARQRLEAQPMGVYTYLDGRILDDPSGRLAELTTVARQIVAAYRTPAEECRAIAHWLRSVLIKLDVAVAAGDELRAAYFAATDSWKILEGLWAINDRPMPPGGGVWAHLADLADDPPSLRNWLEQLFLGDPAERVGTARLLMRHLVPRLKARSDTSSDGASRPASGADPTSAEGG